MAAVITTLSGGRGGGLTPRQRSRAQRGQRPDACKNRSGSVEGPLTLEAKSKETSPLSVRYYNQSA
jgi:hypothetical protein